MSEAWGDIVQSQPFIFPIGFAWYDPGKRGLLNVSARQSGRHTKHASPTLGLWRGSRRQMRAKHNLGGSLCFICSAVVKGQFCPPTLGWATSPESCTLTLRSGLLNLGLGVCNGMDWHEVSRGCDRELRSFISLDAVRVPPNKVWVGDC